MSEVEPAPVAPDPGPIGPAATLQVGEATDLFDALAELLHDESASEAPAQHASLLDAPIPADLPHVVGSTLHIDAAGALAAELAAARAEAADLRARMKALRSLLRSSRAQEAATSTPAAVKALAVPESQPGPEVQAALDFVRSAHELVWRRAAPAGAAVFEPANLQALLERLELWERAVRTPRT